MLIKKCVRGEGAIIWVTRVLLERMSFNDLLISMFLIQIDKFDTFLRDIFPLAWPPGYFLLIGDYENRRKSTVF